jgi:hypothetical protein
MRHLEQKAEALHLRETFSNHRHQHPEKQSRGVAVHVDDLDFDDIIEEEILEEVIEDEDIEEETIVEETEIDEDIDDDDDDDDSHEGRAVSARLHTGLSIHLSKSPARRLTKQGSGTPAEEDQEERLSCDFYFEEDIAFPVNLSDAKQYLARLASSRP